ncbi:MAG: CpaF/VirB11 family protein [Mycoplasmataceae bacterium]|jgi:pilus assembly protein CpaF|nr:CpaF/VirB11 family protein [Mycoplasmataceae bacterium]
MSAIATILAPLSTFYSDPLTIEMRLVKAGMVVIDRRGCGKVEIKAPNLTIGNIENMCRALANFQGVAFDPETTPKLSCIIPEAMHRFECAVGPSVPSGVSLAIRCKHPFSPTWKQIGIEDTTVTYLQDIITTSKNIIVSGATNTGKTTLLNKLLEFLPDDRRVVAVEDTSELSISRFWDGVGLLASREANIQNGMLDWRQLYDHQMRITPDHVIFGEISTQNAFAALAALNSGITGFMCTIHASSPDQVIQRKFEQNIAWTGQVMPRIAEFLSELIDVIIQIKREHDGSRIISDIFEPNHNRWIIQNNVNFLG